jgi:hypothetical protein
MSDPEFLVAEPEVKPSWPRRLALRHESLSDALDEMLKASDHLDRKWALMEFIDEWKRK